MVFKSKERERERERGERGREREREGIKRDVVMKNQLSVEVH